MKKHFSSGVILFITLVSLIAVSTSQEQPKIGCYYTNAEVREKSDWLLDQALKMQSGKTVSWEKFKKFYDSPEFKDSRRLYSEAIALGNPKAFLLECIANTDKEGPIGLLPLGCVYCTVGKEIVGDMDPEKKRVFISKISEIEPLLTEEDKEIIKIRIKDIKKKIKCR
jgi:hypothetical protein